MATDQGALAAQPHGVARSSQWNTVRKKHLKANPYCAACKPPSGWKKLLHAGKTLIGLRPVQVHHIIPFHICTAMGRPELELDNRNLITLCESGENHHVLLGHLGDFQSYDIDIILHAVRTFHGRTKDQIKEDPHWQKLSHERPKDLDKLAAEERFHLIQLIDTMYPRV